MLFNSIEFIFVFFPIATIVFYLLKRHTNNNIPIAWLLVSSLFFYSYWYPPYFFLITTSILFNYLLGTAIHTENDPRGRKIYFILAISTNIAVLAYFKYYNFIIDNLQFITNVYFDVADIALPLAISFFTFQQIAYLVDIYSHKTSNHTLLHYSTFVSFFPQLIAGPIVHHNELIEQFDRKSISDLQWHTIYIGMAIFIIGLFKKIVLADSIGQYADAVFSAADAGKTIALIEGWIGSLSYSFQIYFDFSGYADMAIGSALILGITLPINFNSPYRSTNIINFWKSWHITLSKFLKDYLYIPLGGNRKGSQSANIMITMLIGGLWHGASWNFVLWGGLHGLYILLNHSWIKFRPIIGIEKINDKFSLFKLLSIFITFSTVTISWVFFRSENFDGAINMLNGMIGLNYIILPSGMENLSSYILPNDIIFSGNGRIGSVNVKSSLPWLFLCTSIAFFPINTNYLLTKSFARKATYSTERHLTLSFTLISIYLGILFFVSLKYLFSTPDQEFIYFNF